MAIKTEFSEYIKSEEGKSLLQEVGMQDDTELLNYIDGNNYGCRRNEIITEKLAILLKTLAAKSPSREEYILPIQYTLHEINGSINLGNKIIDLLENGWYFNGCVDSILQELYIHKTKKDIIVNIVTQEVLLEKDTIRQLFQVTYKPEYDKKNIRERNTVFFTKFVNQTDNEVQYGLYNNINNNNQYCILGEKTDLYTYNNKRKEKIINFEKTIKEALTNGEWYKTDLHDIIYTKHNYFINETFEKIVKNK